MIKTIYFLYYKVVRTIKVLIDFFVSRVNWDEKRRKSEKDKDEEIKARRETTIQGR